MLCFKQKTAYEIGGTGVQTCALPISGAAGERRQPQEGNEQCQGRQQDLQADLAAKGRPHRVTSQMWGQIGRASCRKECRSRWSPYHSKKKSTWCRHIQLHTKLHHTKK